MKNSTFKHFLWLSIFALMACGNNAYLENERADNDKPNIVFILADDLGYHQLGCFGSDFYETPNLDLMATEGMRFTNAYAASGVCSPTRSSILTGKYPARNNLTVNIPNNYINRKLITPKFAIMMADAEITMAEMLKKAGYVTGHFGKWHINVDKNYKEGRPGDPGYQGFDDVLTTHKAHLGPDSPFEDDWYHVKHITERSLEFIEKNKNQPFFCFISHNAIHRPEIEKKERIEKYRIKPQADLDEEYGHNNPVQAAMLEQMDKNIGRIIDKLDSLDLQRKTIIVFFSDNGHLRSEKDRQGFRGSKADLYEGGIRVPLIIRWDGTVQPGTICHEPVISNDFYPTFCEIAGIQKEPENIDGINLFPLLRNPQATLDRKALYWHFPHYHHLGIEPQGAIRKGKYKLIENFEKSLFDLPSGWELFDLSEDPKENTNLIDEFPEIASELKNDLYAWRLKVGAQMMEINNDYVDAK